MFRKRIGNVTFFPGVHELPTTTTATAIARSTFVRKVIRLERLSPVAARAYERLVDGYLAHTARNGGAA